jgi:hypothetical protein
MSAVSNMLSMVSFGIIMKKKVPQNGTHKVTKIT